MNLLDVTQLDHLSSPAREALKLDFQTAYSKLTTSGAGNAAAKTLLASLDPESVLAKPARRRNDAAAVLAGLWLWHDWLDESHAFSQSIHTPTGSYWHAILHRREGDFSNAKYWNARIEDHRVYATLAHGASAIINSAPMDKSLLRLTLDGWNADAFVDLVARVHDRPGEELHATCVSIQQLEWRLLFDHSMREAIGG